MKQPQSSKRRVKLGVVVPWTDADLDRLSTITPEDITAASALWRANAGALANLLDAEPVDAEKPANS